MYSKNPILDALEHVGHGIKVVFTDGSEVITKLPTYIEVAKDAVEDAPTIVKDTTAVVAALSGGAPLFEAVFTALSELGANPTADIAVFTSVIGEATNIGTYWANVKLSLSTLLTTLGADEKQVAAIFTVPAAPVVTPVPVTE